MGHEQRLALLQLERRLLSAVEELNEGVRRAAVLPLLDGRAQAPEVLRAAELLERLLDDCITIEVTLARRGAQHVAPVSWDLLALPAGVTGEGLRRRLSPKVRASGSADVAKGRQLSNEGQRLATRLRELLPAWPALERPARLVGPVVLRSIESLQASVRALRDATERRLPGHDDETLAALSVCFDCHSVVQVLRRATVVLARSAAPPLSWEDVGEALHLRSRQTTFARYGALDDAAAISALHEDSKRAAEVNDVSTAALVHASTTGRLTLLAAMSQAAETRRMDARRPRRRRRPRDRSQSWKELEKDPVVIAWMIELADRGLLPAGSEYYDPEDPDDGPR